MYRIAFTIWASDAAAALRAPVTEFAYFSLPDGAGEKEKNECWETLLTIPDYVTTVGGAVGSATGWGTISSFLFVKLDTMLILSSIGSKSTGHGKSTLASWGIRLSKH